MRKSKKNKATSWRQDQDYKDKLNSDQEKWLSKFNKEYYNAQIDKKDHIHPEELHKELYRQKNSANTDLVTCTDKAIEQTKKPVSKGRKKFFYTSSDYNFEKSQSKKDLKED